MSALPTREAGDGGLPSTSAGSSGARPVGEVSPLEEVAAEYARERDRDEDAQSPLLSLGERELGLGRPQKATATLKEALKQAGRDSAARSRVLLVLGRAHAACRERTLALACFDLVLRDGPPSLHSEAQLQRALLESAYLLTPRRFRAVIGTLALENPMTLDFDMLRFLVGGQRGYRLDRIDLALVEFQKVWTNYPKGPRAADALLHQALIEGLVLSRLSAGWERVKQLARDYPSSHALPTARVAQACLAIAQGDIERAIKVLALVPEDSEAASEALFLAAMLTSYYLDEPEAGVLAFRKLESVAGETPYRAIAQYHQALIQFAAKRDPAGAREILARMPGGPAKPVTVEERGIARMAALKTQLAASIDLIETSKDDAGRDFGYAQFWYGHHHFTRALKELTAFLKNHPDSSLAPRAKFLMGKIQQEDVSAPDKARVSLSDSLEGTPGALRGEVEWRRALSKQGEDGATEALEAIYKDDDNAFKPLAGIELARQGAMDERGKRELLHQVIAREPSGDVKAKLFSQLARAYSDAGNPRRALEVYQEALPFDSALGPEISRTRTLLEIQDLEAKLARGQLVEAKVVDPAAQLRLGQLYLALGEDEEAKKAFRTVLKALPTAPRPVKQETRDRKKGVPVKFQTSPLADAARFELMKLNVKAARFPTQALRYVHDFLREIGKDSALRADAMAVKAEILEKEYDPENELVPTYRYLVDRGYDAELHAVKLARALQAKKNVPGAIAVLTKMKWTRDHGPEGMLLLSELQAKADQRGAAISTLELLARRFPDTEGGKQAAAKLGGLLAADLGVTLSRRSGDAEAFRRAIDAFFARMKPEWVGPAKPTIERLAGEPFVSALTLEEIERLIDLYTGSKEADPKLSARLQDAAARRSPEPQATQHRLEQALSLAAAGEAERAVTMLTELAPRAPAALLHVAILQEREFKDVAAAITRLDELLARSDVPADVRTKAVLRRAALSPAGAAELLEGELARMPDEPAKALVYERLAELVRGKDAPKGHSAPVIGVQAKGGVSPSSGNPAPASPRDVAAAKRAAALYLAAARAITEPEEKVRLTLEGARGLIGVGEYVEASKALRAVDVRDAEGDRDPRIHNYFMRAEALSQLERLQRGVNWDDPESPNNMRIMLAQARLLISPLREYDRAQALLSEIEPFFPKASSGEVGTLRREMSHRWSLRALEDKEEKLPRDLMQLAVSFEEDLGDYGNATRSLKELITKHPKDPLALVARFRLIRLFTLRMNRKSDAAKLAVGLGQVKEAADFKPEVAAAINLVVAQSQYETDRHRLDLEAAAAPQGSPEMVRVLARMGRTAVVEFRDMKLATEVLQRMLAYRSGSAGAEARVEAYKLSLLAAVELSPLKAAVYALVERARLLATALELAEPGEERARVLLEQGHDHVREQDLERAARSFDLSSREAPSSPYGREALLNLAQAQVKRKDLDGARDAYERLANSGARRPLVRLASKQLPKLEKLARSREREIVLAQASQLKTPYEYYRTAKEQLHQDEDLDNALINFRTYLRLGKEQKNLVDAYLETAEILTRQEKARDALDVYKKLQARFPDDRRAPEVSYRMAQLHEVHLADLKTADSLYRKVRKTWPRTKWAQESAAGLARLAETKKERQEGEAVAAGRGGVATDIAAIRKKYLKEKGNYTEALEALRSQVEATTAPAERAQIFLELGTIHDSELKDYAEAVKWYAKFVEEASNSIQRGEIHLRIAALKAEELREPEEALELYREFGDKYFNHPKRIDALLAMARLQEQKLNDVQAAINIYRNIADSYPRSGYDEQALIRIAELSRTHFADYPGAVEALRRLVRDFPFSPFSPQAQLQIAQILEVELGDKASAQTEYQRLIDAYPQSGFADGARQALVRLRGRQ